ncbi:unnamed protein product [Adineta steineri]|uniref:Microbial-type PARG catalytic domain-containing protein n=1 Tax=Adineta steineri TaxID=433720 RepID=A0A814IJS3_9BILA|nr:unnamed protein product [Adineta steineri]CAF1502397.1 unnamed protein product [Adineta steineri]
MHVLDNQIRNLLLNDDRHLTFDLNGKQVKISLTDTLELVSYIVLDITKENKNIPLPTAKEISIELIKYQVGEKLLLCDQLNAQFPNIYQFVCTPSDQLLHTDMKKKIYINGISARIYYCADCSFFENLPKSITQQDLKEAIEQDIEQGNISSSSLHIQLNEQTRDACVIVTDKARKWVTTTHLNLHGKSISKKNGMICRLLLYPVPQTYNMQQIFNHEIFHGKVISHEHNDQTLTLVLSDKKTFDECLKFGILKVNGDIFHIKTSSESTNSEGNEINAATWYKAEMLQYKPDIMQFVVTPEHIIFHYRWNATVWLDEFERSPTHPRDSKATKSDNIRHLLRTTVMLNTIAAIRKKSYILDGQEVKLNLNNKLKTIVYDHKSKLEQCDNKTLTKTPYEKTTVEVVQEDCLVIYEDLFKNNYHPLLLNMANATTPGGGYRKGDGAQEENLFRRSDYFRSLDIEFDEYQEQQSDRFYCTSDCQMKRIENQKRIYPMDEFGAIYTSGLTVFRQSEDHGYEYMKQPLGNVCAVAMAAYREPRLEDNRLTSQYAVGMRKKIENIFAIAYHHKHDSLVLSALGCGAFKNPPDHVAELFMSVIEQYAGFFKTIIFAIIDDHNTGRHFNREGNFKPFQVLNGRSVTPFKPMNIPNAMFGPYRLLSDGETMSDVCIFDSTPCQSGAQCKEIQNSNHARNFSHPPVCAMSYGDGKCSQLGDSVHMQSFIHQKQCPDGGECLQIDNEKHKQQFEHPSYCSKGSACQNMDQKHLRDNRHLPLCPESQKCKDFQKNVKPHCNLYRHCALNCPYGGYCIHFHDENHRIELQHPFRTPCPFTPYHCRFHNELMKTSKNHSPSETIRQHCSQFAHVCPFGRNCTDTDPKHKNDFIHVARVICSQNDNCPKLKQEDHLNSFSHKNIRDIRSLCDDPVCNKREDPSHYTRYRHIIQSEDDTAVKYHGVNANIDFVENQKNIIAGINNFFKNQQSTLPSIKNVPEKIRDWLCTVQPVYRCNSITFESILYSGYVMSQDYMKHLENPKFLADIVLQHSYIQRIDALKTTSTQQIAKEYIIALINKEYGKNNGTNLERIKEDLSHFISSGDRNTLKIIVQNMIQVSTKLHSNMNNLSPVSDNAVSCILGPNLGHYYGDIVIVFKREILHHPDTSVSIQSASSFASGDIFRHCPWLGKDSKTNNNRAELYYKSKLQASIPGFVPTVAMQLIAMTSIAFGRTPTGINLESILNRWMQVDSHETIEANLPQLIPTSYIDHIYIPQNIFNSLNSDARKMIDAIFKDRITKISYNGDSNPPMKPYGPKPEARSRIDYQDAVVEKLIDRFSQHPDNSIVRPIQGFAITVSPSQFNNHIVVPLTISQAYSQYRIDCSQRSRENTIYIYWQVLKGDMMLTLSNERIDSSKQVSTVRSLICYVAEKPAPDSTQYHENASYLNSGFPHQHDAVIRNCNYAANSNTFYIGCNTDDFMTFCLEIQRSTGKITLSHAGPNSLYNHTNISYTFGKTELDLSQLEFVHISTGTHTVPIRNLMIWFDKQPDLHPTPDKQFKIDSSPADVGDQDLPLIPCPDNVNCLLQLSPNETTHNSKYSHPCRFSELCRNHEPYLTHEPHQVPNCQYDDKCDKLIDPIHRASYRHTDWPDFLVPCRFRQECRDKSDKHRIKYSHGEQVIKNTRLAGVQDDMKFQHNQSLVKKDQRTPCKWGLGCRDRGNREHYEKYSHSGNVLTPDNRANSSARGFQGPPTTHTRRT